MAFPSTSATKQYLDETTDSPANARSELAALVDKVNEIISSYAQASGICDLDSGGKIPVARLPIGSGGGLDADTLDGEEGSFYRSASNLNAGTLLGARFNDTSHGSRSGGSLHAAATTSVAGFMSAADKTAVNGIATTVATAVANGTTTSAIGAATAGLAVYAVGSYVFALNTSASIECDPGDTIAGTYLRPSGVMHNEISGYEAGIGGYVAASIGSGTWRCMGYAKEYNGVYGATLWLRIA